MPTWQLHASHSHLYPGARLRPGDAPESLRTTWQAGDQVLVAFADQSVSAAQLRAVQGDGAELAVDAYRTAKGTGIAAKVWRLRWAEGGVLHVHARVD